MPLTPEEERELAELEKEYGESPSTPVGLSPEEEAELASLEQEFAAPSVLSQPSESTIGDKAAALGYGTAQGITSGFGEEASALVGATLPTQTDVEAGRSYWDRYSTIRDQLRAKQKEAEEKAPGYYMGGTLAGSAAQTLVPGLGALGKGAATGKLATQGAISGLGYSEGDLTKGEVGEAAKDVALGATIDVATGKAFSAAEKGVSKLLKGKELAPELAAAAEQKAVQALKPTPSEYAKLERTDQVQKLGRELLDQKVTGPFSSVKKMAERLDEIKEKAGSKIGEFVDTFDELSKSSPDTISKVDYDKIINETREQIAQLERTNKQAAKAVQEKLDELLEYGPKQTDFVGGTKTADLAKVPEPRTLNELKSFKQGIADKAYVEGNISGRDVKNALRDFERRIDDEIVSTIERSNIGTRPEFQEAKRNYTFAKRLEKIADRASAKDELSAAISVPEAQAIAAGMVTGSPSIPLVFAAKRGVKEFGKQIQATTLDKLSRLASKTPERLGRWADTLSKATERGPTSLAATNFILSQKDAEYREFLKQLEEEKDEIEFTEPSVITPREKP